MSLLSVDTSFSPVTSEKHSASRYHRSSGSSAPGCRASPPWNFPADTSSPHQTSSTGIRTGTWCQTESGDSKSAEKMAQPKGPKSSPSGCSEPPIIQMVCPSINQCARLVKEDAIVLAKARGIVVPATGRKVKPRQNIKAACGLWMLIFSYFFPGILDV